MSIPFFCEYCHRRVTAPTAAAGRVLKCPGCENMVPVPYPESKPESPPKVKRYSPANVIALILIVALLGGIVALVLSDKDGLGVGLQVLLGVFVFVVPLIVAKSMGAKREIGELVGAVLGLFLSWIGVALVSLSPRKAVTKKCAFCAERIKKEAIVCKHCGRDVAAPSN